MKKLFVYAVLALSLLGSEFHTFDTTDANGNLTGTKTISKSLDKGKTTLLFTKTSESNEIKMVIKDSRKIIIPVQGKSIPVVMKNDKGQKRNMNAEPMLTNSAFYIVLTEEDEEFIKNSKTIKVIARDGFNNAYVYKFVTDGLLFSEMGDNKKQGI